MSNLDQATAADARQKLAGSVGTFLNACTGSRCVPFDNRARLQNLEADGGLKALPP